MTTAEKILAMKQERANIVPQTRALMDEYADKEMPGEKKDELAKLEAKFDKLNQGIIAEEKQLDRERLIGEEQNKQQARKEGEPRNEVSAAFLNHIQQGNTNTLKSYRDLVQDNPTQAGYLVAPEQFSADVIKGLDDAMFMRKICKVLPPLKGAQSLGFPKRTARMTRAAWGTEISAPTTDTSLAFGKREFKPKPASAEILISNTLMRNRPDADTILRDEMVFMFGELEEIAYMNGSAVNQPLGVFIASDDGIGSSRDVSTGNTVTEIKFDGLYEAKYSIKQQYQARLAWIFHRDAVKQIAKLKDGNSQYIWQPSVVADQPDRLLSKPVYMTENAPHTFTTGLYVGILGDFQYYWIVDGMNMEIQVLTELYARQNQIDYLGRIETDGMPVLDEAFARVKLA
jgi:HK97 family phage major capsid protein